MSDLPKTGSLSVANSFAERKPNVAIALNEMKDSCDHIGGVIQQGLKYAETRADELCFDWIFP